MANIVSILKKWPGFPDLTVLSEFTTKIALQRLIDTALWHHKMIIDLQAEVKALKSRVNALQVKSDTYITNTAGGSSGGTNLTIVGEDPILATLEGTEVTIKIAAPEGEGSFILTSVDGVVGWTSTVSCE